MNQSGVCHKISQPFDFSIRKCRIFCLDHLTCLCSGPSCSNEVLCNCQCLYKISMHGSHVKRRMGQWQQSRSDISPASFFLDMDRDLPIVSTIYDYILSRTAIQSNWLQSLFTFQLPVTMEDDWQITVANQVYLITFGQTLTRVIAIHFWVGEGGLCRIQDCINIFPAEYSGPAQALLLLYLGSACKTLS